MPMFQFIIEIFKKKIKIFSKKKRKEKEKEKKNSGRMSQGKLNKLIEYKTCGTQFNIS